MRDSYHSFHINRTPPYTTKKLTLMSDLVVELVLLGATLASILLFFMTAWCLATDLRLAATFPISSGPFSNWLVWLGAATATQSSRRIAHRREILCAMLTAVKGATAIYAGFALFPDLKSIVSNAAVLHQQLNRTRS